MTSEYPAQPEPLQAGLRGLCPRCEAKTMFQGMMRFAPRCLACGLDFSAFNVGDGPAAFLTLIIGAIVTIGAIWLHLAAGPPVWVHVLLWPALALVLVIGSLRVAKGWLLALEFRNAAREGRIRSDRP